MNENLQLTESAVRNRLYRRGYKLVTTKDVFGCKAYYIADLNDVLVCSQCMTFEEVGKWACDE